MNLVQSNIHTMTSRDMLDLINSSRLEFGEPSIRLNKLNEKIVDELEGEHYTKSVVQNVNNTESTIYHLTVDQCTLIGMRESKAVRRAVLIKLKSMGVAAKPPTLPANFIQALEALVVAEKEKALVTEQLAIAGPKVEFYDQVTDSTDAIDMASAAKVLNIKGYGRNKLFAFLREKKVLQDNNQPYQSQIDANQMRVIESRFVKPNGDTCINLKTVVYQRGLDHIRKLVAKG